MRSIRLMCTFSAVAILTGCATTNVLYSDAERIPHTDQGVVSLVYDRFGDIYPSARVHVPGASLRRQRASSLEELRLSSFFRDQRASGGVAWRALLDEAQPSTTPSDTSFAAAWEGVQNALRQRLISQLKLQTQPSGRPPRPLVVLVHGFNNNKEEALAWYEAARTLIRPRVPDAVYLDVYWDGLSASAPPSAWGNAQYNFPLVGLEFRRVLNALDRDVPIRVLTHSSGGPLIANTFGDASAPFRATDGPFQRYQSLASSAQGDYRPPNPKDFRVAMIAPAAASNTFRNFLNADGPDRVILGINPDDVALTKAFMRCTYLGSTCINRRSLLCREVVPAFAANPHTRLFAFDFSKSGNNRRSFFFWDAHDMTVYFRRDDMSPLLDLLLGDQISNDGEAAEICGHSR